MLIAEAYYSGIQAEYSKLYAALKDNFNNEAYLPASFTKPGYVTQPAIGGKACSETLEWMTGVHSMALLSAALNMPIPDDIVTTGHITSLQEGFFAVNFSKRGGSSPIASSVCFLAVVLSEEVRVLKKNFKKRKK